MTRRNVDKLNRRLGRVGKPKGGQGGSREPAGNINIVAEQPVQVRMEFLRKVYSIITVQLATSLALVMIMVAIVNRVEAFYGFVYFIFAKTLAMLAALICILALEIKQRETPTKYCLLAIYTLLQSFTVGIFVIQYDDPTVYESVIQSLVISLGLCVALNLYTMQSQRDFPSWLGPLMFGLCFLIIFCTKMYLQSPGFVFELSLLVAILFCALTVIITQSKMSKVSEEDYISVVVTLNMVFYLVPMLSYILLDTFVLLGIVLMDPLE